MNKIRCILLATSFISLSCNAQLDLYYPEKHDSLSQEKYDEKIFVLEDCYKNRDPYQISIALLQLKEPSEMVYEIMDEAIVDKPVRCCGFMHYLNNTYSQYSGSKPTRFLSGLDSIHSELLLEKCKLLMDSTDYKFYKSGVDAIVYREYPIKVEKKEESQELIDLKNQLYLIHANDLSYRGFIGANEKVNKNLEHLQAKLDKENQEMIASLLNDEFPKAEVIGELALVPWRVLHHSRDKKFKMKHLDFLRMQVDQGEINGSLLKAYLHKMNR